MWSHNALLPFLLKYHLHSHLFTVTYTLTLFLFVIPNSPVHSPQLSALAKPPLCGNSISSSNSSWHCFCWKLALSISPKFSQLKALISLCHFSTVQDHEVVWILSLFLLPLPHFFQYSSSCNRPSGYYYFSILYWGGDSCSLCSNTIFLEEISMITPSVGILHPPNFFSDYVNFLHSMHIIKLFINLCII